MSLDVGRVSFGLLKTFRSPKAAEAFKSRLEKGVPSYEYQYSRTDYFEQRNPISGDSIYVKGSTRTLHVIGVGQKHVGFVKSFAEIRPKRIRKLKRQWLVLEEQLDKLDISHFTTREAWYKRLELIENRLNRMKNAQRRAEEWLLNKSVLAN